MEYVTLNNGMKMPMAGIGTFLLTPDEAEASVLIALEKGYRLIDTANAYVNEKAVGRAMKKSGLPREEMFVDAAKNLLDEITNCISTGESKVYIKYNTFLL